MRCGVHGRFGGRAAAQPCWLFPVGASFGAGWQGRCGERDCVSVWPPASASSDSGRYWRAVLTPALPSTPRSVPFPPPSASPHPNTRKLLADPEGLPSSSSVWERSWETNTWVLSHSRMDGTWFWAPDFIHDSPRLPVSSNFTIWLFLFSLSCHPEHLLSPPNSQRT